MNPKISLILIFCLIFCLQDEIKGQTVDCKYGIFKLLYTCALKTTQTNFNESVSRIDGQHKNGRTDDDVEYIGNYEDNYLKTFSSIFCEKFPNLAIIEIEDAELESIDEESLKNCKDLEHLKLNENKIRELSQNLLIANAKLTVFEIHNNQLTTLPKKIFANQRELKDLELNHNKLHLINPEWFEHLQNLKRLRLNDNQISEVPSKCFASLKKLEELLLQNNRINKLHPSSFDGLHSLKKLNLDHNEISDLPTKVFAPLKNLRSLSLDNNNLTTIHSDSFSVHNQLFMVFFDNNKINAIDEAFIDNAALSYFHMMSNICSDSVLRDRRIKEKLKTCFDNYLPRPLNISSCGRPIMAQGNVIGGTFIVRGSYPWIAAMFLTKYEKAGKFFCGGTVVSSRKIVTAAHCIQEKRSKTIFQANEIKVLLGVHDLNQQSEDGRITRDVQKIHMHPSWNVSSERYDADIAVLVLKTEVAFGSSIQPICLMEYNLAMAKIKDAVVVGYGKSEDDTKEHENIPKILEVPIHKNEVCFLENNILAQFSSKRTFCGGSGNGTGVCRGDSGSGVFLNFKGNYFLRGIVSSSLYHRNTTCDVNTYAIFTDVLKFTAWVEDIPVPKAEFVNDLPVWD